MFLETDKVRVVLFTDRAMSLVSDFASWSRNGETLFGTRNVFDHTKEDEREFGQSALERYTGSRVMNQTKNIESNQWTTKFGELGAKVVMQAVLGRTLTSKVSFGPCCPDLYDPASDTCYEVKTQSYSVPGTAGEKIYAVPFKYKKLGKKVVTILAGSLESKYKGLIYPDTDDEKHTVSMLRDMCNTTFVGASQLVSKVL